VTLAIQLKQSSLQKFNLKIFLADLNNIYFSANSALFVEELSLTCLKRMRMKDL